MSEDVFLITHRMVLKEFKDEDIHFLYNLDSDPAVMEHIDPTRVPDKEHIQNVLDTVKDYYQRYNSKLGLWMAYLQDDDQPVGWFHLRPDLNNLDDLTRLEVGYRLNKKFWGKGLATEGAFALVRKAFLEYKCKEVFGKTMKNNRGSARVLEKCGLEFKRFYKEDHYPDKLDQTAMYFSQTRSQWLSTYRSNK